MGSQGTANADVQNSIGYGSKLYAALDDTHPLSTDHASQSEFLALPSGWGLAEYSEDLIYNVVSKFTWCATRLVLSNGDAYGTRTMSETNGFPLKRLGVSGLLRDEHGKVKPKVITGSCVRVLICAEIGAAAATAASRHCVHALTGLWEDHEFADCEVECDGEVFKCHRGLLAHASPVFKRMLSGEMREAKTRRVQVEAAESQAVSAFLKFIYTGNLDCEGDRKISVAKLADFYQVDSLVKTACTAMLSEVDKNNVARVCRFLQSTRERPDFAPYWEELVRLVRGSEELTRVLMTEMR